MGLMFEFRYCKVMYSLFSLVSMGKRLCYIIVVLPCVFLVLSLWSCTNQKDLRLCRQVDEMNQQVHNMRYSSAHRALSLARKTYVYATDSVDYPDGRNEALCHIAFLQYMRMDYAAADSALSQVDNQSQNEVIKLMSDVIHMRICQRRSANQLFYEYCNSARKRIERIGPEECYLTSHLRSVYMSACSDYHLALTMYYYYVRQEDEAKSEFKVLADDISAFSADSTQLAMYYFLSGNVRNIDNRLHEDNWQNMVNCITIAQDKGYSYIQAKALSALASDLIQSRSFRPSRMAYLRELLQLNRSVPDSQVGLLLGRKALGIFHDYGSLFDESETYITLSDYYLYEGNYEQAFRLLTRALNCINEHYIRSNPDDVVRFKPLKPYIPVPDSLSEEMRLIHHPQLICVPEWMADVREHLCLVYSALGMKTESDYNRNIYLDILDAIRQDRRMEQRLQDLKSEEQKVDHAVIISVVIMVVLVILLFVMSRRLKVKYHLRYEKEKAVVEQEMEQWRKRIDIRFSSLEDYQANVEAERYNSERSLTELKQRYIDKTTCLSIVFSVMPFLDRALNEVKKLNDDTSHLSERLTYICELTRRIDLYNSILTHWIKMRRGVVALSIENFSLAPLFDIVRKGETGFAAKNIQLNISRADVQVKADKALTLFMINTLLENARKYTREGGKVWLEVEEDNQSVLISVKDTGRGLSEEDCKKINQEKVYDSSLIGDVEHDSDLRKNKGYGFGLMNCKGIIEKYKKTSRIFSVCQFGVKSILGEGSTFYFRLPKGNIQRFLCLFFLFSCSLVMKGEQTLRLGISSDRLSKAYKSSNVLKAIDSKNPYLLRASDFADSTYYANVGHRYTQALQFVDSACSYLNKFYQETYPKGKQLLRISGIEKMPEIEWWKHDFKTDYYIILDIRNEAAISALALNEWNVYYYNNEIYTRLYKLMAQDETLEQYCNSIHAANANKQTALIVTVLFLAVAFLVSFSFYYRSHILPMFNLRQILEVSQRIFDNEDTSRLSQIIYEGVNEILPTDGVCLMLPGGDVQCSDGCPQPDYLIEIMKSNGYSITSAPQILSDGLVRVYPLCVEDDAQTLRVGTLTFVLHRTGRPESGHELLLMLSKYAAINIYYESVRVERLKADIQMIDDERRRVEYEMNRVHVQNMVLDNCLSAIKHETMYYPSRIKQIAENLLEQIKNKSSQSFTCADERENPLPALFELTTYYKSVYSLLAACAARQMGQVPFRRSTIPLNELLIYISNSFQRQAKRLEKEGVMVHYEAVKTVDEAKLVSIKGDLSMIKYLFDNAISVFLQYRKSGTWTIDFAVSDKFVKFACGFDGIEMNEEQMLSLFYPESIHYDELTDRLLGAQFLIAKQIIREHDDNVRRGCRIYAEPRTLTDGTVRGMNLIFTIPQALSL